MQSASSSEALLTDLCAICHANPLKYTCPRCGIHTCSLPCVKRHKQWAQCSGIRDPAEYRKRADLATPSSIDKDYNFITKVERTLQQADDTVLDKGIDLTPARFRWNDAKSKLDQETESRGITIIRAPKGLSRNKQNKTHWAGNAQCIMWTIEWIREDGQRTISNTHETKTVIEAYNSTFIKPSKSMKRKRARGDVGDVQTDMGDRKANALSSGMSSRTEPESVTAQTQPARSIDRSDQPQSNVTRGQDPDDTGVIDTSINTNHTPSSQARASPSPPPSPPPPPNIYNEPSPEEAHKPTTTTTVPPDNPAQDPTLNFYLHNPQTPSKHKSLVLLPQTTPLQSLLSNKTLLEFPTIYIRTETPEQLSSPFILNTEYKRLHGGGLPIHISGADVIEGSGGTESGERAEELDETRVLEVLAKDLS